MRAALAKYPDLGTSITYREPTHPVLDASAAPTQAAAPQATAAR